MSPFSSCPRWTIDHSLTGWAIRTIHWSTTGRIQLQCAFLASVASAATSMEGVAGSISVGQRVSPVYVSQFVLFEPEPPCTCSSCPENHLCEDVNRSWCCLIWAILYLLATPCYIFLYCALCWSPADVLEEKKEPIEVIVEQCKPDYTGYTKGKPEFNFVMDVGESTAYWR